MKKRFILASSLLLSMNIFAGGYDYLCEGNLSSGTKITFDREDFVKISASENEIPGNVVTMKVSDEGSLFPKEAFELRGYPYQSGSLEVTAVIDDVDYEEGGEACIGGHMGGVYGSKKTLEATYEDYETQKETIELTCIERGGYSGNCQYE